MVHAGRDRRGGVSHRTQGAVVALKGVMVLVDRGQEERAQKIEHDQPAEQRVGPAYVDQSVLHGFPGGPERGHLTSMIRHRGFPCQPRIGLVGSGTSYPFREAQIIPSPHTIKSTGQ